MESRKEFIARGTAIAEQILAMQKQFAIAPFNQGLHSDYEIAQKQFLHWELDAAKFDLRADELFAPEQLRYLRPTVIRPPSRKEIRSRQLFGATPTVTKSKKQATDPQPSFGICTLV